MIDFENTSLPTTGHRTSRRHLYRWNTWIRSSRRWDLPPSLPEIKRFFIGENHDDEFSWIILQFHGSVNLLGFFSPRNQKIFYWYKSRGWVFLNHRQKCLLKKIGELFVQRFVLLMSRNFTDPTTYFTGIYLGEDSKISLLKNKFIPIKAFFIFPTPEN